MSGKTITQVEEDRNSVEVTVDSKGEIKVTVKVYFLDGHGSDMCEYALGLVQSTRRLYEITKGVKEVS